LIGQARAMLGETSSRALARQQLQAEERVQTLQSISSDLIATFEVERLMDVLAKGLPKLGIPSCYLALYEDPQPYQYPQPAPEWSRLILAYNEEGRVALEPEGRRFSTQHLVPEGMLPTHRRYTIVLQPLYFQDIQIGFVLFEVGPQDWSVYEVLRGEIASALQGALLVQQEEKRARQLQTVAEVSTATSTILDTAILLQEVVDLTKERFGLYHAHIYLLNDAGDTLDLVAGADETGRKMVAEGWQIPLGREQSLVARAARSREGIIVNDVRENPDWLPNPLLPKTRSELAIPLIAGGRVLGVLDVQASQVNYFTGDTIQIQSMLAAQVAVALENARLFEETQTILAETSSLYQASRRINEANDLQEIIAAIAEVESASEINRLMVEVFERDPAGEVEALIVAANWHSGQGTSPPPVGTRFRMTKIPYLDLLLSSEPTFFDDVLHDERLGLEAMTLIQQSSTQAMAILPLWVGTRQLGDLIIEVEEVHHFTERERRIYTSLAGQTAVAVENQRLLAETQAVLAEMEATQRRFTIQAWEAYRSRKVAKGYEQVGDRAIPFKDDSPPEAIETISHRQPTLSTDGGKSEGLAVKEADRDGPNEKLPVEAKSSLVIPLTVRGEVVGVLGLQDTDEAREWTPEEISLVEAIAQQIAQAAENLRLIDETQQRAARGARIGEIGEKIRGAQSLEDALQIAIREVGLSLNAPQTTVQLKVSE
jgi:GAF domain-containing protein